jgi:hypothetical protein
MKTFAIVVFVFFFLLVLVFAVVPFVLDWMDERGWFNK